MVTLLMVLPFCNDPPAMLYAVEPAAPVRAVPYVLVVLLAVIVKAAGDTVLVTVATFTVVAPVLVNTTFPE